MRRNSIVSKATMTEELVVAAAQIDTNSDLAQNLAKIESRIHEAAAAGCDVVLFHEGCLTGYPDAERVDALDFEWVVTAEERIRQLAEDLSIAVLVGTTGRRDGQVFNDLLIIDRDGRPLGRYAKTWRAGEPWYAAGSGPVIFNVCGVEATAIICHDLRYPELTRLGVTAGARIVFIANNESGLSAEHKLLGYRSMQISRATENLCYAVMANAPADADNMHRFNASHGNSMIVDPAGNALDEAGSFEERLVMARIDLRKATGNSARRTLGESDSLQVYGTDCEHPGYAEWIRSGLSLVRRLDGEDAGGGSA
jgi:omega-amidase